MRGIFISFRKNDARLLRQRVDETLTRLFGRDYVFKSGESITPGADFPESLIQEARGCEIMLVLIGPQWLGGQGAAPGTRRIWDEQDWVRREVAESLRAGNRVVPVLLGDGTMLPQASALPPDITDLASRHCLRVTDTQTERDLADLAGRLINLLPALGELAPGAPEPESPAVSPPLLMIGDGVNVNNAGGTVSASEGGTVNFGGTHSNHVTNKRGGMAGAAVLAEAAAAVVPRSPLARTADWITAHARPITLAAVATVVVGGSVAIAILASPDTPAPLVPASGSYQTPSASPSSTTQDAILAADTPSPTATGPTDAGDLLAVVCEPDAQWETIDTAALSASPQPYIGPATGGCNTWNIVQGVTLYSVSPDRQYLAESMDVNSGKDAGYQPLSDNQLQDQGTFVDGSGNNATGFAQESVHDDSVLFNPATGDLWWRDNDSGHLFSNTVPPTTPVDHGPGALETFTPTGQPMPLRYFDSPDGSRRVVFTQDEYGGWEYYVGSATAMTSQCLQAAAALDNGFCGGATEVTDKNGDKGASGQCEDLVGWVDNSTVVCITRSDQASFSGIAAFPIDASGTLGTPKSLIPTTGQTVDDAIVTPDGKQVLFFLSGGQGTELYLEPTDGSGVASNPTPLQEWPTNAGQAVYLTLGWILPNGHFAS